VISGGSSFGNNPLTPTIGLGRARAIHAVEITWPDGGTRQVVRGLPLDRAVEITERREGFRLLDWTPIPRSGVSHAPIPPPLADPSSRLGPTTAAQQSRRASREDITSKSD
jgi:hypothetical protein